MMSGVNDERWNLVSHHLDCLLELPEQQRESYLAALAPEQPAVVERLRQLLSASGSSDFSAFLGGSAMQEAGRELAGPLAGRAVGPYVIDSQIGVGGIGTVWRAHRADGRYKADVAIKFIHPAWLGAQGEQRFRLEGQMLARLQHQSIARLVDAGMLDGAQPYLVLEYVDGIPIDEHCDRHKLDREARVALFIDVLEAVAHAHSRLIVHRDLKPSNVLVNRDGAVKLLDFGIAKLLEDGGPQLTQSSARALTPQYAAPEQINGNEVTTATDVYALGLLLYLLLAGVHPLEAGTAGVPRSGAELMRAILAEDPPRLSSLQRNRTTFRRFIAGDLDNILAKALDKRPESRYRTASAFADDLRRYLSHEPVQARADTVAYRVAKFAVRHRGAVTAGVLTAAGLIATSTFALLQMSEARTQRDVARAELQRAEAASDFTSQSLEQAGEGGLAMTREQLLDRNVQMLDARYGGDREFVADMLTQIAARYSDEELNNKAMELTRRAVDLARQSDNLPLQALTLCEAAWQDLLGPEASKSEAWLREAQQKLAQVRSVPLRTAVSCLLARESLEQSRGNWDGAMKLLDEAHALQVAEGIDSGPYYSTVLREMATIHFVQGRYDQAHAATFKVGQAFDRGGRGGTRGRAMVYHNLGTMLVYLGEPRAALADFEASRQTVNGTQADEELAVPSRCAWAWTLRMLGQQQRARRILAGVADKLLAEHNIGLGSLALIHDAGLMLDAGEVAPARAAVLRAMEQLSQAPQVFESELAQAEAQLAEIDSRGGQPAQALKRLQDFLAAKHYPAAPASVLLQPVLMRAARVALALGDIDQATAYSGDALALAQSLARGQDTSADVGEMLLVQAQIQLKMNRPQEAGRLMQRAVTCLENGLGDAAPRTREARRMLAELSNV